MWKSLLGIIFGIALLAGCQENPVFSVEEIQLNDLSKESKAFFENQKNENGVYLFHDSKIEEYFVYFNQYNVNLGDPASMFKNIEVKQHGNDLSIYFDTEETKDYSTPIKNQLYYKITLDKSYDTITIYKNGEETFFNSVSGK